MSMDPEIKAAWVAELRAGTRAQGSGRLRVRVTGGNGREVERWCCLGVLCDLAERAGVVTGRWVEVGHPVYPGDTVATYAYRTVAWTSTRSPFFRAASSPGPASTSSRTPASSVGSWPAS